MNGGSGSRSSLTSSRRGNDLTSDLGLRDSATKADPVSLLLNLSQLLASV